MKMRYKQLEQNNSIMAAIKKQLIHLKLDKKHNAKELS